MVKIYHKVRETGLNCVKLENCGMLAGTAQDWEHLLKKAGKKESVNQSSLFLSLLRLF